MNTPAENLLSWEASGFPREWVDQRNGQWTHAEWEALLSSVESSEFWPMEPEGIGVLLEKLRKTASAKDPQGQALPPNTEGKAKIKKTAPARDTVCSECGNPDSAEMAARGVEVTLFRVLATFACLRCKAPHKVDLESIDKAEGIDVRCSCGAIAHLPPSVWCQTCGKGMSTGWQSKISAKR